MKAIGLLAALLSAPAFGQRALFLTVAEASTRVGGAVEMRVFEGDAPVAWPAERVEHFFARTAWTQENRDSLAPAEGAGAAWIADRPGVLMLGIDLEPRTERLDARTFEAFVHEHVAPDRRVVDGGGGGDRGGLLEVVRVESAKALVRVEHDGAPPDSIATSKSGQAVEIRPLMDPTRLVPGSDLAVRVYAYAEGAAPGIVTATNTTTGAVVRATADVARIATIRIGSAGRWRLEHHAARALPDGRYELQTATLTFDVREVAR